MAPSTTRSRIDLRPEGAVSDPGSKVKPKLRGTIHEIAFFVSLLTGPILIVVSRPDTRFGTVVFAVAMSGLFGASALYHKPDWKPTIRKWLRRLDHTMILVMIVGTFTPIAIALGTTWSTAALIVAWSGVVLGSSLQLLPISMPKPVVVVPYLALGWFGLSLLPATAANLGIADVVLIVLGGAAYTFGAIVYARQSPNPSPAVFGYHEIFHAATVVAAYLHYAAIASAIS